MKSVTASSLLWPQDGAFGFFHDLAVTEHYYVLLQNPTKLDFRKLAFEYVIGAPPPPPLLPPPPPPPPHLHNLAARSFNCLCSIDLVTLNVATS